MCNRYTGPLHQKVIVQQPKCGSLNEHAVCHSNEMVMFDDYLALFVSGVVVGDYFYLGARWTFFEVTTGQEASGGIFCTYRLLNGTD